MPKTATDVLLIFVKNPEKGKVKTRLAQTLGDEKALEAYQKLTSYTRKISLQVDAVRQVWYSGFIPENDRWGNDLFDKKLQQGADLGQRMKDAFSKAFKADYKKAVIIGSDCAELTSKILEEAFTALDHNDLVIGPSKDGGYYLLGMNQFYGALFENIKWSTSEVFSKSLQIARKKGLNIEILQELNDVDYEEDWQAIKGRL